MGCLFLLSKWGRKDRGSLVNQPPSAVVYWLVFPHQALYGHTQAVTCLAASVTYSIFVSGSDDRTCIIWDLNQLTFINQLPAHEESLTSVAINNSTVRSSFIIFLLMHPWTFHDNLMGAFPNIKTSWESDTLIFFLSIEIANSVLNDERRALKATS